MGVPCPNNGIPWHYDWTRARDAAGIGSGHNGANMGKLIDDFYKAVDRPIPKSEEEELSEAYEQKVAAWKAKQGKLTDQQLEANNRATAKAGVPLFKAATEYMEKLTREKNLQIV